MEFFVKPNIIKELREDKGLTQTQLGKVTKLSRNTISSIERGEYICINAIAKIAHALGVGIEELKIKESKKG